MSRQAFTAANLRRVYRPRRIKHSDAEVRAAADSAARQIQSGSFSWGRVTNTIANGSNVFFFKDLPSELVLSKLTMNISRAYNVNPSNRDLIIDQVRTLLTEQLPFSILTFDIKNFFENIDRYRLLRDLDLQLYLSAETRNLLTDLLKNSPFHRMRGLPRGLPISTPLSELYLAPLDQRLRQISTVYYYARFVDDIVIFCSMDPAKTIEQIHAITEDLRVPLNTKKHRQIDIQCPKANGPGQPPPPPCFPTCKCKETKGFPVHLEYLGYRFNFSSAPNGPSTSKPTPKTVEVTIAQKKIKKIKTRLARAFVDYTITEDYSLLVDRVRFLTGTFPITRRAAAGRLKGGNHFNYSRLTDSCALRELDDFKSRLVYSRRGTLGKRLSPLLTRDQKNRLARISFQYGYANAVLHRFTRRRIYDIKRCFPR
ncbi:hypothetical protein J2T57_001197 [Natronocella acetinitrilica]|uniref:Reverse transcriptase domain-containing protein n=1 Tax=Natronocella acetinitrilica TaxID=414046 RepID=A0AAE3G494_9GAMM|nr:antiviral reverse transcriptase Drt3a [Natronocella acetinitrilica]MCP1674098.1 hypothetical protein [Natronocella acetinitrilica]